MFSKIWTTKSIGTYSERIASIRSVLDAADAVVIGAGSGLSVAAGLTYAGERFQRLFSDFIQAFDLRDMYSAGFYPFPDPETYWAYWSRHIDCNRYHRPVGRPYQDLRELVQEKDYFVLTTNVDHCFQDAGFDKRRLFYTQGDYGLWQCSRPCHPSTYDNAETVRHMVAEQRDLRVPSELIPHCPRCGGTMSMNLRCDETFVEDEGWRRAAGRYGDFLRRCRGCRVVYLELGVGGNTPAIIKYPFWRMTKRNSRAAYVCLNLGQALAPKELTGQSVCIDGDLADVLKDLRGEAADRQTNRESN